MMYLKKRSFILLFLLLILSLIVHPVIITEATQNNAPAQDISSFMPFLHQLSTTIHKELITFESPYLKITSLDTKQYTIVKGVRYHVLIDEYLENNDPLNPDVSKLTREYFCYDGIEFNDVYPSIEIVAIEKVATIKEAKDTLKILNPDSLKFPENTLISLYIKDLWLKQYFEPLEEYHENSLKGLTLKDLQEMK